MTVFSILLGIQFKNHEILDVIKTFLVELEKYLLPVVYQLKQLRSSWEISTVELSQAERATALKYQSLSKTLTSANCKVLPALICHKIPKIYENEMNPAPSFEVELTHKILAELRASSDLHGHLEFNLIGIHFKLRLSFVEKHEVQSKPVTMACP